jgi:hypothetical protein
MSYETYAHVSDIVDARPLEPVRFKGIAREVIPYEVVMPDWSAAPSRRIQESSEGFKIEVNLEALDAGGRAVARAVLLRALREL